MESVRKAGSFLGSDAAVALSDKTRQEYLERTAPGKAVKRERKSYPESNVQQPVVSVDPGGKNIPGYNFPEFNVQQSRGYMVEPGEHRDEDLSFPKPKTDPHHIGKAFTGSLDFGQYGGAKTSAGFSLQGTGGAGVQSTNFLQGYQAPSIPVGERGRDAAGTRNIQQAQMGEILTAWDKKVQAEESGYDDARLQQEVQDYNKLPTGGAWSPYRTLNETYEDQW